MMSFSILFTSSRVWVFGHVRGVIVKSPAFYYVPFPLYEATILKKSKKYILYIFLKFYYIFEDCGFEVDYYPQLH